MRESRTRARGLVTRGGVHADQFIIPRRGSELATSCLSFSHTNIRRISPGPAAVLKNESDFIYLLCNLLYQYSAASGLLYSDASDTEKV